MATIGLGPTSPMLIVETPGSSAFTQIGFSPLSGEATVQFRKDKNYPEYVYSGIPPEVGLEFLEARSKGKFFHQKIAKNPAFKVTPTVGSYRLGILSKTAKKIAAKAARALITRGR